LVGRWQPAARPIEEIRDSLRDPVLRRIHRRCGV